MNSPSGTKPGDVLVKKPRVSETPIAEFVVSERRIHTRTFSSPMLLILIFVILISVGTFCLMTPFAHHEGSFGGGERLDDRYCDASWVARRRPCARPRRPPNPSPPQPRPSLQDDLLHICPDPLRSPVSVLFPIHRVRRHPSLSGQIGHPYARVYEVDRNCRYCSR